MAYTINNVDLSVFGIKASRVGDSSVGISGILDFPKRKGTTEYSWGTSVEAFVSADDLTWEGRSITFKGLMKGSSAADLRSKFAAFKAACTDGEVTLSTPFGDFDVVLKDGIDTDEIGGNMLRFEVKFLQQEVSFEELTLVPTSGSGAKIDNYNLRNDFGIIIQGHDGYFGVPQRIDIQTSDNYKQTAHRQMRDIQLNCLMVCADVADLLSNMGQFHALLSSAGLRTFTAYTGDTFQFYVKDGFTISRITTAWKCTAKFQLTLRSV